MKAWRQLLPWLRPFRRLQLAALATVPLTTLVELTPPVLLKLAVDHHLAPAALHRSGLGPGGWRPSFTLLALLYLVVLVGEQAARFVQGYLVQLLGQRLTSALRRQLHGHIFGRNQRFFDTTPVGQLTSRVTSDIEAIQEVFSAGVLTVVADATKLIAIVVVLLRLDTRLALMTFAALIPLGVVVELARRRMRDAARAVRAQSAAMFTFLQEHLAGIKVVQWVARQRSAMADFRPVQRRWLRANMDSVATDAVLFAVVELVATVTVAALLWLGTSPRLHAAVSVGTLIAFVDYIGKFFVPVRDLSAKYSVLQSALVSAERVVQLLADPRADAPPTVGTEHETAPSAAPSAPRRPTVPTSTEGPAGRATGAPKAELRDVAFWYGSQGAGHRAALRGVSLTIPEGETLALVGATGSGKSTVLKLLVRLYEPNHGQVLFDGTDVRRLATQQLRRKVALLTQEPLLLAGTVRDNLRAGLEPEAPGHDDAAVWAALDVVGARTLLERRADSRKGTGPGLLDTVVRERGLNFSPGERQLLVFARTLLRAPELLLLDEATAHLDRESEAAVDRGLAALLTQRTAVIVAHRLSTVRHAHRIAVVHLGAIAELGSHDELMAQTGVYRRLYELQLTSPTEIAL